MRLNVPFIPDDDYVRFLADLGDTLEAVHYSLYDSVVSDARIRLQAIPEQRLAFRLRRLPDVRKYLLANGRFHAPERYRTLPTTRFFAGVAGSAPVSRIVSNERNPTHSTSGAYMRSCFKMGITLPYTYSPIALSCLSFSPFSP